jgi:predicted HAD superfamily phosphohydrolase
MLEKYLILFSYKEPMVSFVKPRYVGLDVEGPLVNPASDFAWKTYDELLSEPTKTKFPRARCESYDERYDDFRYLYDLNKSRRHSTGMWPSLSLALAAIDGKTDDDLIALAEKTTKLNPGTDKLMNYLLEKFDRKDRKIYLITSSHSPVGLSIAEKYGIPFKQVFTHGFQPSRKILSQKDFVSEVKERSPMAVLSEHKEKLGTFLSNYLNICEGLGAFYDVALHEPDKIEKVILNLSIKALLAEHDNLFDDVNDFWLKKTLQHLFLDDEYVMGSHRKVDAMRHVCNDGRRWTYVDDGIVGAMPIDYADYGFSINMTNKHALPFSKLNVATADMSNLIPVYETMLDGEFGLKTQERLDSEELRVFTPRNIQQDIENVIKVNREMKNKLKDLYVSL